MFYLNFIVLACLVAAEYDNIAPIKIYLESLQTLKKLTLFSCWNTRDTIQAFKFLLGHSYPIRIVENVEFLNNATFFNQDLIIIDSNCSNFKEIMLLAESLYLFNKPLAWILINFNDTFLTVLEKTRFCRNSHIVVTRKISDEFHFDIVYKHIGNDTKVLKYDLGINATNRFMWAKHHSNLAGAPITISYVITQPRYQLDFENYRNHHIDSPTRLSYITVFQALEMLNCTKKFMQQSSWGYANSYSKNNTIFDGGMFGDIEKNLADVTGTSAFYTNERLAVSAFLTAPTPSYVRFILRAPPLTIVRNLFTLPFVDYVWYALYLIVMFTVAILYIIVICENKYKNVLKTLNNVETTKPYFLDVVLLQIGAITQQGSESEPKTISGRIAVLITFLVLMFLYTAYSANIVVLLQTSSKSIRTVDDLLYSKIALGSEDQIYNRMFFQEQKDPIRKTIYEKKIAADSQKPNFMTVKEGVAKIRNEFFAFNCETTNGYKVIMDTFHEHEKCDLIEIDYFNFYRPDIAVRKSSPYKELIKMAVTRVQETGVRQRQINRIYYRKPQCAGGKGSSFTSVGIIDAYFPCVIFCTGFIFSLFILIGEILFKYRLQHKQFGMTKKTQNK